MRKLPWRAAIVIAVVAASVFLVATRPARLGLDLRGGTQIVLEAMDTESLEVDADTINRTLEVLRRRVDQLGIAEPTLQRSGDRRVIVELPGVTDPDEAVGAIGRTAQLAFHQVQAVLGPDAEGADGQLVVTDESGARLALEPARVTGNDVSGAEATLTGDLNAAWQVEVDFRGSGSDAWSQLTGEAACAPVGDPSRRIAILLDEDVISSPQVDPSLQCDVGIADGATRITGSFSEDEARELALLIRAGALPVPVEIVQQRTVGPTLGDAAIRASAEAAVIGAALTILYMIVYYRILGLLAAVALAAYGAISYAVLLGLNATLTLPGIAGLVLAIGMAVDANVLVYERIKEERAGGAIVRRAADAGFRRAWSAIADSNATTLIAAAILFFYASGAVRGFGVTLSVGVLVSLFSALVVTRLLVDLTVRTRLRDQPKALGLEVGGRFRAWIAERRPDLLKHSRRWLVGSGAVVAIAILGMTTQGFNYGLDFSGGKLIEYDVASTADLDQVRERVADAGFPRAIVQTSGEDNIVIRTGELNAAEEDRIEAAVQEVAGPTTVVRDEFVGPTVSNELRRKAVIALSLALAAQLAYVAFRFRWTYGAAAVLGMFHDVLILLGVFVWLGKDIDGVFVASLLTVVGYSVNDSVVVFDRVRELRKDRPRDPLLDVANDACLQTVPRTINTGLGALFILTTLYFLGGDTLQDFALALLIGIIVGTYSSVFTATPLAVFFESLSGHAGPVGSSRRLQPAADSASTSARPGSAGRSGGSGRSGGVLTPSRQSGDRSKDGTTTASQDSSMEPEAATDDQPPSKPPSKQQSKPGAKPTSKPAPKPGSKPAPKPGSKSATRPAPESGSAAQPRPRKKRRKPPRRK